MKPCLIILVVAASGLAAVPAHAQLVSERVENLDRICLYNDGNTPAGVREYRIGLGDSCSAHLPAARTNVAPPPTARLESSSERNGRRVCSYAQRYRQWTIDVPLDERCPMNAGMLAARQSPDEETDD